MICSDAKLLPPDQLSVGVRFAVVTPPEGDTGVGATGVPGVEKYASPEGVVHHAKVTIGDSAVEMGEANGPYQPMPTMFYLYVPDVDASHYRAVNAGAASMSAPADQPYGDRTASVKDAFGNVWYLATQLRETR